MHDPMTVVCDIPSYRLRRKLPWLPHLVTVWHRDPERDGGDDSCDWFGGKRCPQKTLDEITRTFLFEGRDGGAMSWFGDKKYSPDLIGVGLCMFRVAANHHFGHWSRKAGRFLGRNLFDILHFIDNGCDSINEAIRRADAAGGKEREDILKRLAHVVYAWILRRQRPWWQHPRWHVWHWRLQVHPVQTLKRWLFSRCAGCGRGFSWGYCPVSGDWNGTGPRWFRSEQRVYHHECGRQMYATSAREPSTRGE